MSNTVRILLIALAAVAAIAICAIAVVLGINLLGGAEATPTVVVAETPPPTTTAPVADDSWERIQAAGKIVVGTAADYPPFEYYVDEAQIDGFDIALMDEIGRRLGVAVEYRDFAFDGLGSALELGQIDAAIAAISVTPERESFFDFSNVYLVSEDGVLAREGADITVAVAGDLIAYRVGVQRGSVYQDWLQADLVDTGQMPADNLFVYEKATDAYRDLKESRIDLMVLDIQPAKVAVADGGVEIVGQGLNQMRLAVGLPKGAQALRAEIDRVITNLNNEGFIAQLARQYLGETELQPTPTPAPTSTPGPAPECVDGLSFLEHPPGDANNTERAPGEVFSKVWRVQNTGTCTWDSSYRLVHIEGARMGGAPTQIQGTVAPGQTYDIAVSLVAPLKAGTYQARWQMQNGQQRAFGQRLPITIRVAAVPTVTPAPTQTPVAGITFTVDRNNIQAGECVNFYWKVENVKEVYFYLEGEFWGDNPVTGEETRRECPPVTSTYFLRVVLRDGSVEVRQITINVESAPDAPYIERFTVDPAGQITLGQCVTVRWNVQGEVDVVRIFVDATIVWDGAPIKGTYNDCPDHSRTVNYGISAEGPGGVSQQDHYTHVVDQATATPVPTPAPEAPAIHAFSVRPGQMVVGECTGVSWNVGGGASYSRIQRNGEVIIDDAGYTGQQMDCLDTAGSYTYRLEAYNPAGESVSQEREVTVTESVPQNPLAGTRWQATALNGQSVLEGTTLTAAFGANGSLNGSAGCNSYSTRYLADDTLLSIFLPSVTGILCSEPVGIMEQEQSFLAALQSASSFSLEGGQLFVNDINGQVLVEFVAY
jgi:polar amino acid transport system substrate-binding protein